jgi:hypothetical protein
MSEKSKSKSFIEGLPAGFVQKVRGLLDFDEDLFMTQINLPVIYFNNKEDIGPILKVIKKLDFGNRLQFLDDLLDGSKNLEPLKFYSTKS